MSVLLVEDNELVRGVLTRMLQSLGHRVCVAADGEEALARAVTYPDIDVLLTDAVMPHMNGPQLAQRLTAQRAGLAVIFMSGYAESVVLKKGWLSSGVLLKKPFSAAELESCLRHAVEPRSSKARTHEHRLPTAALLSLARRVAYHLPRMTRQALAWAGLFGAGSMLGALPSHCSWLAWRC